MDSFFENADLHCFKRDLKSEDFINSINTVCALSAGLKVPVEELPEYISQQNKKADEINEGIERLKTTKWKPSGTTLYLRRSLRNMRKRDLN
jgi:hypothetical protein